MRIFKLRVLGLTMFTLFTCATRGFADDLPPPPETEVTSSPGTELGAELPPPPEDLGGTNAIGDAPPLEGAPQMIEPAQEAPPLNAEAAEPPALVPEDVGLSEVTPVRTTQQKYNAPAFSSSREITDLSVGERLNAKELVLWLYLGPSYASLQTKGSYTLGAATMAASAPAGQSTGKSGGLGYSAGIGFMLGSTMQAQLDFLGTPRTTTSTIDQAMFGLGPRFGFVSLMALVGVQRGVNLSPASLGQKTGAILAVGAKATIDIILGHSKDSRVSYGISPEAFYVTSQADDGYSNAGASVSFRIFGYENAF
ncbi:MAG: hypothetical protein H7301_10085 [Cryobacterium sp.]|nr:hypothetical protein [Oligoflexia bacterium]